MMQNVEFKVTGAKLVSQWISPRDFGPSKSGKTVIVATTGGNADTGYNSVRFGLNVFAKSDEAGRDQMSKPKENVRQRHAIARVKCLGLCAPCYDGAAVLA